MAKKRTRIGWIGRGQTKTLGFSTDRDDVELLPGTYRTKGYAHEWDSEDWPPVKVRVTVEIIGEAD